MVGHCFCCLREDNFYSNSVNLGFRRHIQIDKKWKAAMQYYVRLTTWGPVPNHWYMLHDSLDECWPKIARLDKAQYGLDAKNSTVTMTNNYMIIIFIFVLISSYFNPYFLLFVNKFLLIQFSLVLVATMKFPFNERLQDLRSFSE